MFKKSFLKNYFIMEDFLDIETIDKKYEFNIFDTFNGNLIPVGGGKDSIVTLELLKNEKVKNKCFLYKRDIYPTDMASLNTIYTAGYENFDILSFNVTLPYSAKSNNASTVNNDGKKLSWNLSSNQVEFIEFEFELYNMTVIYTGVGAIVLILVIIIFIFSNMT